MDPNSAPAPDGFSGIFFFQKYWSIVGNDISRVVRDFFLTGKLCRNLNSNFLVLIPKVDTAIIVSDFRPIVLSNFLYKIIAKILADRLSNIASRIVSSNQFGFIPDRRIHECIAIASEAANNLDTRTKNRNMILKLDIKKAFDTISWDFVLAVLQGFCFGGTFCNWIKEIFESNRISVLFNGSPHGFFSCSRGARQRDPLSPLLFGIAEDFLSRSILTHYENGNFEYFSSAKKVNFPSHLFYADDILIFGKATKANIQVLRQIFYQYSALSSQHFSLEKSKVMFGSIPSNSFYAIILYGWPIPRGFLPMDYLGVPIFKGPPNRSWLQKTADKIRAKL